MTDKIKSLSATYKIGFLGSGQLARMSGYQAFRYGMQTAAFSNREETEPLQFITPHSSTGSFSSAGDMIQFAKNCDVLTLENEFIESAILATVQEKSGTPIYPSPESFELIENKLIEKQTFEASGIPVTPYSPINNKNDIKQFTDDYGWPFVMKSSKGGYDGYGNETVADMAEAQQAFKNLGGGKGHAIIAEAFVDFTKELAVQVARNNTGHVVYPCCETVQKEHICVAVQSPAPVAKEIQRKAQELALKATKAIDGVGIFAFEFFLTPDGELLLNESAPRPHNSGHYTIEGCITSQFENHVRAVSGLPLGSPDLRKPSIVMINLLGDNDKEAKIYNSVEALNASDGHLHIYGKLDSRPGRKMGHYTLLGDNLKDTYERAQELTDDIEI